MNHIDDTFVVLLFGEDSIYQFSYYGAFLFLTQVRQQIDLNILNPEEKTAYLEHVLSKLNY